LATNLGLYDFVILQTKHEMPLDLQKQTKKAIVCGENVTDEI